MALPAMATHLRGRATSTASMANCAIKTLTYRRGWATPTASMANCAIKAPRDYPWAAVQGAMAVPAMTTHLRGRPRPETTRCATTLRGNALFLREGPNGEPRADRDRRPGPTNVKGPSGLPVGRGAASLGITNHGHAPAQLDRREAPEFFGYGNMEADGRAFARDWATRSRPLKIPAQPRCDPTGGDAS
jgi:hypothetical protein